MQGTKTNLIIARSKYKNDKISIVLMFACYSNQYDLILNMVSTYKLISSPRRSSNLG